MSRPIFIRTSGSNDPVSSPIDSLGRSFGAQRIVDNICESPLSPLPFSTRAHAGQIHPSLHVSETPEFQITSYLDQGGRIIGSNGFAFGTPPMQQPWVGPSSPIMPQCFPMYNQPMIPGKVPMAPFLFPPSNDPNPPPCYNMIPSNIVPQLLPSKSTVHQQPQHVNSKIREPSMNELLTRVRMNPTAMSSLRLSDIRGHVLEFSKDQVGSRFIQKKLEQGEEAEKDAIFEEVVESTSELVNDIFGNYVVQKFFEYGEKRHSVRLIHAMKGKIVKYAFQMFACRVLQKALEKVDEPLQMEILKEIRDIVLKCMEDQNGNHVIQKAVEKVDKRQIQFILDALLKHESTVHHMAVHTYGCRVVQRILEFCSPEQTEPIIRRIHDRFDDIVRDQYGNYVIQHVVVHGSEKDRIKIIERLANNLLMFSTHKFSSNVIEKCLTNGSVHHKDIFVRAACRHHEAEFPAIVEMMKDQYANYVVQKMFDQINSEQRKEILYAIKPHLELLRRYQYGKHILAKLEKYFQKQIAVNPTILEEHIRH